MPSDNPRPAAPEPAGLTAERVTPTTLRMWDLVRYCRHDLFEANLITREEYGTLVADVERPGELPHSARRLEAYDTLRATLDAQQREIARLREGLEMIAGIRRCPDNLMGNVDIARAALKEQP